MIGLPSQTKVKRQLSKSAIYTKFQMNNVQKEKLDSEIAKLVIVNEVLPSTVNIAVGKNVKGFFAVHVTLKKKDYDERTIMQIAKLIPQKILFILEFDDELQLAVYHSKFIHTEWMVKDNPSSITLKGYDFDVVWENVIIQIGEIEVKHGNSLDEQMALDDKKDKLEKELARLEKQARNEKQPKKKFELSQKINSLKDELSKVGTTTHPKIIEINAEENVIEKVCEPIAKKEVVKEQISSSTVKALSILPEFAADIFDGFKTIEWRSWKTDYRGDLLICASSRKLKGCISGYALCMVTLKDIVPFTRKHLNGALMDFVPNPPGYAWILDNVRLVKPFPYKGKLHIYDVDASLVEVLSPIGTKQADEEFEKYYKQLVIDAGGEF